MKKTTIFLFFLIAFFGLIESASADVNLVQLPSTTHIYTNTHNGSSQGTGNGSLTFDGNFSTYMGNTGNAQGNESIVISEHTFASPVTVNSVQYRIRAGGWCGGNYDKSADYVIYVQYKVGGIWYYLPGSQFSNGAGDGSVGYDTGNITYSSPIANVTAIRAYARGQGHGEDRASNGSYAEIYEIDAFGPSYSDIGLRVYDGVSVIAIACEPAGTLTSPLRIRKGATTYGVVVVDTSDANASKIRIRTSAGVKALRKY